MVDRRDGDRARQGGGLARARHSGRLRDRRHRAVVVHAPRLAWRAARRAAGRGTGLGALQRRLLRPPPAGRRTPVGRPDPVPEPDPPRARDRLPRRAAPRGTRRPAGASGRHLRRGDGGDHRGRRPLPGGARQPGRLHAARGPGDPRRCHLRVAAPLPDRRRAAVRLAVPVHRGHARVGRCRDHRAAARPGGRGPDSRRGELLRHGRRRGRGRAGGGRGAAGPARGAGVVGTALELPGRGLP